MNIPPPDTERMAVTQTDSYIIVTIPKDLMVFAQKERPDFPLTITDKDSMGKWVCRHLLHWGGDTEEGVTEFDVFLDNMFVEAYQNAETWIEEANQE